MVCVYVSCVSMNKGVCVQTSMCECEHVCVCVYVYVLGTRTMAEGPA